MNSKKLIYFNYIGLGILLPMLLIITSNIPKYSYYREAVLWISVISWTMLLAEGLLSNLFKPISKSLKLKSVQKWHKRIAYFFGLIIIAHPILILLPKEWDKSIGFMAGLDLMIESENLLTGIIAYCLLLTIIISGFFRKSLPFKHKTWRTLHGILSGVFVVLATHHVLNIGRHSEFLLGLYWLLLLAIILFLLFKRYFLPQTLTKIEK